MSKIKNYEDIQGWFDFQDVYSFIVNQVKSANLNNNRVYFCEVGCWMGKSTAYLASLIRDSKCDIKLYVIDNFEGDGSTHFQIDEVKRLGGSFYEQFIKNMNDLNLLDYVTPLKSNSTDGVNLLPNNLFSFIYIDADHKYESVISDLEAYWPKIHPGGVLAGHDFNGTTERAVMEFSKKYSKEVKRINMSWVIIK